MESKIKNVNVLNSGDDSGLEDNSFAASLGSFSFSDNDKEIIQEIDGKICSHKL